MSGVLPRATNVLCKTEQREHLGVVASSRCFFFPEKQVRAAMTRPGTVHETLAVQGSNTHTLRSACVHDVKTESTREHIDKTHVTAKDLSPSLVAAARFT